MLLAKCQAEEHSHAINILAHECGQSKGEKISRSVLIRADVRPKTPQKDKSATFMECEADMIASADEATRGTRVEQIIVMLEQNNHGHAKYSKRVPRKPMVQRTLKQTFDNIKTRSHPLRITAESDPTYKEKRAICIHQCKECSNLQLTISTEYPRDIEDNQWRVVGGKKKSQNRLDQITTRKQPKADCLGFCRLTRDIWEFGGESCPLHPKRDLHAQKDSIGKQLLLDSC